MIKIFLISFFLWSAEVKSPPEVSVVTVKGMVCSFCAQGIEKKLLERKEISKVDVDLDSKKITLYLKPGQKVPETDIREIITKAGYDVVGFHEGK